MMTALRALHIYRPSKTASFFDLKTVTMSIVLHQLCAAGIITRYTVLTVRKVHLQHLEIYTWTRAASVFDFFRLVLVGYGPLLCLLVLNGLILYAYHKETGGVILPSIVAKQRNAGGNQLLIIFLLSNLQFLVTVMPTSVFFTFMQLDLTRTTAHGKALRQLPHAVAMVLLYSNYASNFIVYCLFGSRFRRELKLMLYPQKRRRTEADVRFRHSQFPDFEFDPYIKSVLFSNGHCVFYAWTNLMKEYHTQIFQLYHGDFIPVTVNHTSPSLEHLYLARKIILAVFPILYLIIGVPGNILTIMVLRRRKLKDNFLTPFLTTLAIFNICILLTALPRYIGMALIDIDFQKHSLYSCMVDKLLILYFVVAANWSLVMITAVRAHHIFYPQKSHSIFSRKIVLTSIFLFQVLLLGCAFVLQNKTVVIDQKKNGQHLDVCTWKRSVSVFNLFRWFLVAYGPLSCLIVLNGLILYGYKRERMENPRLSLAEDQHSTLSHQLLVIVLLSNLQFLITVIPTSLYYSVVELQFEYSSVRGMALSKFLHAVTVALLYSNYATNFLIYCLCGTRFRKELKLMLYSWFGHQEEEEHSEYLPNFRLSLYKERHQRRSNVSPDEISSTSL